MRRPSTTDLVTLEAGTLDGIRVKPRWPAQKVFVSREALSRLQEAQSQLPPEVSLILTRGYEAENSFIKWSRLVARHCGALLFCCLYPTRIKEYKEIFSSNGHDLDGNHIDIGIAFNRIPLDFLLLRVFTPISLLNRTEQKHAELLNYVWKALREAGFTIHSNRTEALQIHCDLRPK